MSGRSPPTPPGLCTSAPQKRGIFAPVAGGCGGPLASSSRRSTGRRRAVRPEGLPYSGRTVCPWTGQQRAGHGPAGALSLAASRNAAAQRRSAPVLGPVDAMVAEWGRAIIRCTCAVGAPPQTNARSAPSEQTRLRLSVRASARSSVAPSTRPRADDPSPTTRRS